MLGASAGPPITDAHAATKFPLLLPSLRGLVHFSHMLSVEYFADILQVLLQLIRAPGLPLRTRLECLLAASDTHRCIPHRFPTEQAWLRSVQRTGSSCQIALGITLPKPYILPSAKEIHILRRQQRTLFADRVTG